MSKSILYRFILILIVFFMTGIPVSAQELEGNADSTAVGKTAVTAKVEMPTDEKYDSQESENVKTGDESNLTFNILLLLISTTILAVCVIKEYQWKSER